MATLRIRDDVVYREVDGMIVAFSLDTGEYVALDSIGTDLWRFIEEDGRVDTIRNRMLSSYEIDEASCDEELNHFVAMLTARRLVTVDSRE
jgi:hypothetical protein